MTQDTNQYNEDVWGFFHPLLQSGLYFSFLHYCSHKGCAHFVKEGIQPLLVLTAWGICKFKPSAKQLKVAQSTHRRGYILLYHTLPSLLLFASAFFAFSHNFALAALWGLSRSKCHFWRRLLEKIFLLHLAQKHLHSCWPSWFHPWLLKRWNRNTLRIQKYVFLRPDLIM